MPTADSYHGDGALPAGIEDANARPNRTHSSLSNNNNTNSHTAMLFLIEPSTLLDILSAAVKAVNNSNSSATMTSSITSANMTEGSGDGEEEERVRGGGEATATAAQRIRLVVAKAMVTAVEELVREEEDVEGAKDDMNTSMDVRKRRSDSINTAAASTVSLLESLATLCEKEAEEEDNDDDENKAEGSTKNQHDGENRNQPRNGGGNRRHDHHHNGDKAEAISLLLSPTASQVVAAIPSLLRTYRALADNHFNPLHRECVNVMQKEIRHFAMATAVKREADHKEREEETKAEGEEKAVSRPSPPLPSTSSTADAFVQHLPAVIKALSAMEATAPADYLLIAALLTFGNEPTRTNKHLYLGIAEGLARHRLAPRYSVLSRAKTNNSTRRDEKKSEGPHHPSSSSSFSFTALLTIFIDRMLHKYPTGGALAELPVTASSTSSPVSSSCFSRRAFARYLVRLFEHCQRIKHAQRPDDVYVPITAEAEEEEEEREESYRCGGVGIPNVRYTDVHHFNTLADANPLLPLLNRAVLSWSYCCPQPVCGGENNSGFVISAAGGALSALISTVLRGCKEEEEEEEADALSATITSTPPTQSTSPSSSSSTLRFNRRVFDMHTMPIRTSAQLRLIGAALHCVAAWTLLGMKKKKRRGGVVEGDIDNIPRLNDKHGLLLKVWGSDTIDEGMLSPSPSSCWTMIHYNATRIAVRMMMNSAQGNTNIDPTFTALPAIAPTQEVTNNGDTTSNTPSVLNPNPLLPFAVIEDGAAYFLDGGDDDLLALVAQCAIAPHISVPFAIPLTAASAPAPNKKHIHGSRGGGKKGGESAGVVSNLVTVGDDTETPKSSLPSLNLGRIPSSSSNRKATTATIAAVNRTLSIHSSAGGGGDRAAGGDDDEDEGRRAGEGGRGGSGGRGLDTPRNQSPSWRGTDLPEGTFGSGIIIVKDRSSEIANSSRNTPSVAFAAPPSPPQSRQHAADEDSDDNGGGQSDSPRSGFSTHRAHTNTNTASTAAAAIIATPPKSSGGSPLDDVRATPPPPTQTATAAAEDGGGSPPLNPVRAASSSSTSSPSGDDCTTSSATSNSSDTEEDSDDFCNNNNHHNTDLIVNGPPTLRQFNKNCGQKEAAAATFATLAVALYRMKRSYAEAHPLRDPLFDKGVRALLQRTAALAEEDEGEGEQETGEPSLSSSVGTQAFVAFLDTEFIPSLVIHSSQIDEDKVDEHQALPEEATEEFACNPQTESEVSVEKKAAEGDDIDGDDDELCSNLSEITSAALIVADGGGGVGEGGGGYKTARPSDPSPHLSAAVVPPQQQASSCGLDSAMPNCLNNRGVRMTTAEMMWAMKRERLEKAAAAKRKTARATVITPTATAAVSTPSPTADRTMPFLSNSSAADTPSSRPLHSPPLATPPPPPRNGDGSGDDSGDGNNFMTIHDENEECNMSLHSGFTSANSTTTGSGGRNVGGGKVVDDNGANDQRTKMTTKGEGQEDVMDERGGQQSPLIPSSPTGGSAATAAEDGTAVITERVHAKEEKAEANGTALGLPVVHEEDSHGDDDPSTLPPFSERRPTLNDSQSVIFRQTQGGSATNVAAISNTTTTTSIESGESGSKREGGGNLRPPAVTSSLLAGFPIPIVSAHTFVTSTSSNSSARDAITAISTVLAPAAAAPATPPPPYSASVVSRGVKRTTKEGAGGKRVANSTTNSTPPPSSTSTTRTRADAADIDCLRGAFSASESVEEDEERNDKQQPRNPSSPSSRLRIEPLATAVSSNPALIVSYNSDEEGRRTWEGRRKNRAASGGNHHQQQQQQHRAVFETETGLQIIGSFPTVNLTDMTRTATDKAAFQEGEASSSPSPPASFNREIKALLKTLLLRNSHRPSAMSTASSQLVLTTTATVVRSLENANTTVLISSSSRPCTADFANHHQNTTADSAAANNNNESSLSLFTSSSTASLEDKLYRVLHGWLARRLGETWDLYTTAAASKKRGEERRTTSGGVATRKERVSSAYTSMTMRTLNSAANGDSRGLCSSASSASHPRHFQTFTPDVRTDDHDDDGAIIASKGALFVSPRDAVVMALSTLLTFLTSPTPTPAARSGSKLPSTALANDLRSAMLNTLLCVAAVPNSCHKEGGMNPNYSPVHYQPAHRLPPSSMRPQRSNSTTATPPALALATSSSSPSANTAVPSTQSSSSSPVLAVPCHFIPPRAQRAAKIVIDDDDNNVHNGRGGSVCATAAINMSPFVWSQEAMQRAFQRMRAVTYATLQHVLEVPREWLNTTTNSTLQASEEEGGKDGGKASSSSSRLKMRVVPFTVPTTAKQPSAPSGGVAEAIKLFATAQDVEIVETFFSLAPPLLDVRKKSSTNNNGGKQQHQRNGAAGDDEEKDSPECHGANPFETALRDWAFRAAAAANDEKEKGREKEGSSKAVYGESMRQRIKARDDWQQSAARSEAALDADINTTASQLRAATTAANVNTITTASTSTSCFTTKRGVAALTNSSTNAADLVGYIRRNVQVATAEKLLQWLEFIVALLVPPQHQHRRDLGHHHDYDSASANAVFVCGNPLLENNADNDKTSSPASAHSRSSSSRMVSLSRDVQQYVAQAACLLRVAAATTDGGDGDKAPPLLLLSSASHQLRPMSGSANGNAVLRKLSESSSSRRDTVGSSNNHQGLLSESGSFTAAYGYGYGGGYNGTAGAGEGQLHPTPSSTAASAPCGIVSIATVGGGVASGGYTPLRLHDAAFIKASAEDLVQAWGEMKRGVDETIFGLANNKATHRQMTSSSSSPSPSSTVLEDVIRLTSEQIHCLQLGVFSETVAIAMHILSLPGSLKEWLADTATVAMVVKSSQSVNGEGSSASASGIDDTSAMMTTMLSKGRAMGGMDGGTLSLRGNLLDAWRCEARALQREQQMEREGRGGGGKGDGTSSLPSNPSSVAMPIDVSSPAAVAQNADALCSAAASGAIIAAPFHLSNSTTTNASNIIVGSASLNLRKGLFELTMKRPLRKGKWYEERAEEEAAAERRLKIAGESMSETRQRVRWKVIDTILCSSEAIDAARRAFEHAIINCEDATTFTATAMGRQQATRSAGGRRRVSMVTSFTAPSHQAAGKKNHSGAAMMNPTPQIQQRRGEREEEEGSYSSPSTTTISSIAAEFALKAPSILKLLASAVIGGGEGAEALPLTSPSAVHSFSNTGSGNNNSTLNPMARLAAATAFSNAAYPPPTALSSSASNASPMPFSSTSLHTTRIGGASNANRSAAFSAPSLCGASHHHAAAFSPSSSLGTATPSAMAIVSAIPRRCTVLPVTDVTAVRRRVLSLLSFWQTSVKALHKRLEEAVLALERSKLVELATEDGGEKEEEGGGKARPTTVRSSPVPSLSTLTRMEGREMVEAMLHLLKTIVIEAN